MSEQDRASDDAPRGAHPDHSRESTENPGPETETQVLRTTDPAVRAEPEPVRVWRKHPDATVEVETNQVTEPAPGFVQGVMVVVEESPKGRADSGKPKHEGQDSRDDKKKEGEPKKKDNKKNDDTDEQADEENDDTKDHDKKKQDGEHNAPQPPSMMRTLVLPWVVALVCGGVAGAFLYSDFFDSSRKDSKSDKQASSSKSSDSTKGSGKKEKKPGSDSKSQADSAEEIPGFTHADDADALRKQLENLDQRIDRLSQRIDEVSKPRNETPPDLRTLQIKVGDLARTVEDIGDLPAKYRRLDRRMEDLVQEVKALRSQVTTLRENTSEPPREVPAVAPPVRSTESRAPAAPATPVAAPAIGNVDEVPDAALAEGITLFRRGKYAEAQDIFGKLQLTSPGDARVWYFSALSRGLATGDWGTETQRLVQEGAQRERAGLPPSSRIDAALAGLTRAQGKDWLASYRLRFAKR